MVYQTDNDNEYPGWREAKQCFYHLNFPVFPIPTTPPKRPWVGLTDEDWGWVADKEGTSLYTFAHGVAWAQARLKEKNT